MFPVHFGKKKKCLKYLYKKKKKLLPDKKIVLFLNVLFFFFFNLLGVPVKENFRILYLKTFFFKFIDAVS